MRTIFAFALLAMALFAVPALAADEVPTLKVGYVFTTHHTPLMVAASKGEAFKDMGVYLRTVAPKERYELVVDGKTVALLDLVVAKSGAETTTLFAQKHLDMAMASVTAVMAGIDKGTPMKILGPLQTEGMALVAPKDSALNDWDAFIAHAKAANEPVKVGYHSPTSAPKIVLEGALRQAGVKVSEDPNDASAQVLLADLKETTNMIPALASKQVDAVVGPSPFPEVAVSRGVGKLVVDLRDLPPAGHWHDYPCCVTAASDDAIASCPLAVGKFVELVAKANAWCTKNKAEAGAATAEWIGIPADAGKASTLVFLSKFNDSWMRGASEYLQILDSMGNFKGRLKDKKLDDVRDVLFDTRFVDQVKM